METAKFKMLPSKITKADIRQFLIDEGCTKIRYSGKSGMFYYIDESGKEQEHGRVYLIKLLFTNKKEKVNE